MDAPPDSAAADARDVADADEVEWSRVLAGDGHAFGRIFDRHRRRVASHSVRLAPTPADAEDVVAITFLEAWRLRERIRFVGGSMLPWLLVTATNVARNLVRSAHRYRVVLQSLPPAAQRADPIEQLDGSHAELAMGRLSPAHRQVVTLCVLEGYTEHEAALALGLAPGTVKSRLSRAKARMRVMLTPTRPTPTPSPTRSTP